MAKSIVTQIREALKLNLQNITTTNGYILNIGDVHYEGISVEEMRNFPCVVIYILKDKRIELNIDTAIKEMDVLLSCFIHSNSDISTAREQILQSVEKLIGTYYMLPPNGVSGCTVLEANVIESVPFGTNKTKPNGGIDIFLKIRYKQNISDPTSK